MSFAIAFTASATASAAAKGASGMRAAQTQLDTSAHNVTNAQTPGFQRQQVLQTTQPAGGVSMQVGREPAALAQGRDGSDRLAQDMVQQRTSLYNFTANLRTVQTQGSMLGTLLDVRA